MSAFNRIALALALAGLSLGQGLAQDEAGAARRAAARMEEQAQASMLLLNEARQLYSQKKFKEALDTYRKSLNALPKSPNMEKRREFLEASIADASVAVAQEYVKVGRFEEAKSLLESALKAAPDHALAKKTLSLMEDTVRHNPALTPAHVKNVNEVTRLLQVAFGYYELGQYDEALKQFDAVLRIDPYNVSARRGQEMVNKRRSLYYNSSRDEMRGWALSEVDRAWERPNSIVHAPEVPESMSAPLENPVVKVDEKLNLIRLPKLQLENATLEEAVDYLRNLAIRHDTTAQVAAEKGINITISAGVAGSPEAKAVADRRITLSLTNIPLSEAVKAVAQAAGLEVLTNPYGIELSNSQAATGYMVTKVVTLPSGFFTNASGESSGNDDPFATDDSDSGGMKLHRVNAQKALAEMGINFPEGSFARFNSSNSTLIFHGTPRDFKLLEDLVAQKSTQQPVQVVVNATFIEVSESDLKELGFNWLVNINLDFTDWFMGGAGTDKNKYNQEVSGSAARIAGTASPVGSVVGGLRTGQQVFTDNAIDAMLERGSSGHNDKVEYIPGGAPSILTLGGVWSHADVTMIMRGLDQTKGADVLQHPSVIVRPGEKASFFSGQELIYPTEYEPPEILENAGGNNNWNNNNWNNNNGNWNNNGAQDAAAQAFTPAHPSAFDVRPLGTRFDVEVTGISEDKSVVEMTVAPEIAEFDGFINYGSAVFTPVVSRNPDNELGFDMIKLNDNLILQPVFSVKRVTSPITIATGTTMVIGSLKKHTIEDYEDKIPILGDIPWIGRLFRSKGTKDQRKIILIMVKAEIVDPTGKQLYTPTSEM